MNEHDQPQEPRRTRRGLLRIATAGLAGIVGISLGKATDAHGATGTDPDALAVDADNASGGTTSLTSTSSTAGKPVLAVTGTNADYGVQATAAGIGVYGQGPIGVYGDGSVGGVFSGSDASVSLSPRSASGAPTGSNLKGDIALDADGVLWLCIAGTTSSNAAIWIKASHGGTRMLSTPFRAFSSTDAGAGGPLTRQEVRKVPVVGVVPDLPAEALAIVANITVHSTQSGGYLTVYPWGTPQPPTSNINWNVSGQTIANAATVGLGDGAIAIYADAGVPDGANATDVIVDVAGYVL